MAGLSRRNFEQEAGSLRRVALEFRERLRKRAMSVDSTWNAAVHECMALFGHPCAPGHQAGECQKCWVHEKLRRVLRLEDSSYVPLKERMLSSLERMRRSSTLEGPAQAAYFLAISDISRELNSMLEDFE